MRRNSNARLVAESVLAEVHKRFDTRWFAVANGIGQSHKEDDMISGFHVTSDGPFQ